MFHRFSIAFSLGLLAASPALAVPQQFSGNGHWYELISTSGLGWVDSAADAAGMSYAGVSGHLATVTSQEEWDFINTMINPADARAWLGGSDDPSAGTAEGIWIWAVGPEAGDPIVFDVWDPGEPNNSGGENYLEGWWNPYWNDIPGSTALNAYIIEYSTADVPLPAAAPLALLGLGALGLIGRRRRA